MGKGQRNRAERADHRPAYELPLAKAAAMERGVRVLGILSLVLLALTLFLPSWSVHLIGQNLAAGAYDAEEIAALTPVIPLGRLALVLLPLGAVAASITLWLRKTGLSLIGLGLQLIGAAMLVVLAITLGDVFAFNPLLHSGHGQGLTFWDLVLRYYILLLAPVMQTVAVCMGFAARKKRDIADVMQQATDTSSTLSLDEEETAQILS